MKRSISPGQVCAVLICSLLSATALMRPQPGLPIAQAGKPTSTADAAVPQPVVGTHELMELFNEQVYDYLREAMSAKPTSDDGWSTLHDRGYQVAEVANLVALRTDKHAQHDDWKSLCADLQQAGVNLTKAADAKDWERTTAAYHEVIGRCNACHNAHGGGEAPMLKP